MTTIVRVVERRVDPHTAVIVCCPTVSPLGVIEMEKSPCPSAEPAVRTLPSIEITTKEPAGHPEPEAMVDPPGEMVEGLSTSCGPCGALLTLLVAVGGELGGAVSGWVWGDALGGVVVAGGVETEGG